MSIHTDRTTRVADALEMLTMARRDSLWYLNRPDMSVVAYNKLLNRELELERAYNVAKLPLMNVEES